MRKVCALLTIWLISALFPVFGQVNNIIESVAEKPIESVEGDTTWYYILSAAEECIPNDKAGIPVDFFPMHRRNVVIFNRSVTENRYTARDAQFNAEEHFAIVRRSGELRLVNRKTMGEMTGSWGSGTVGEPFEAKLIAGTKKQYLLSTGGRSPLWLKWNGGLVADRYRYDNFGAANAGKTTAWYFVPVDNMQADFVMRKQQAKCLLETLKKGIHPGEYADTGTFDVLREVLSDVEYREFADESCIRRLADAVKAIEADVIYPYVGGIYVIRSASLPYDNRGYYLFSNAEDVPVCSDKDEYLSLNYVWELFDRGGKQVLVNKATDKQIRPQRSANTPFTTDAGDVPVTFTYLGGQQWNISSGGIVYHRSNVEKHPLFNWAGGAGSASAWTIRSVSKEEILQPVTLAEIDMLQARTSTGIGNTDVPLLGMRFKTKGFVGQTEISSLCFSTEGTTDRTVVGNYRLHRCRTIREISEKNSIKVDVTEQNDGNIRVTPVIPVELEQGETHLWLVADVSDKAAEGQLLDYRLVSCIDTKQEEYTPVTAAMIHPITVFLTQSTVLACGEYGSKYYRIPAIETAKDGSLIAVTDRRINSNVDLPAHIDIYVNRSTDNGRTWSEPLMIAGDEESTVGYGDAAIVKNKQGRLIVLYNGGRRGLWDSTADEPFRKYKVWSDDNGLTWSDPVDITDQFYGTKCVDPIACQWTSMLLTSGRALCTRSGVLMVAVAAKVPGKDGFSNYVAVSYDDGDTWSVESEMTAWDGGDEAKLAELNNGDILISMRRSGGREFNTSPDNGKTWRIHYLQKELKSPACNGELLYYTSVNDGYDRNRMIHSLPYADNRSNVSVMLSYDEGRTFPVRKTICPTASAYSSLTVLSDGTIGCYFEDGDAQMDMVFVRFSLKWLTDGADEYKGLVTRIPFSTNEPSQGQLPFYTLDGRLATRIDQGLYIISGRKVLVR